MCVTAGGEGTDPSEGAERGFLARGFKEAWGGYGSLLGSEAAFCVWVRGDGTESSEHDF